MAVAQTSNPVTGTATVTVACKILHGLDCRIFEPRKTAVPVLGGGTREETQWFPTGRGFVVRGPAHAQNEAPRGPISSNFALTPGISKALWDEWWKQNSQPGRMLAAVENGLIYAFERLDHVKDQARERAAIVTGQERMDPTKLPQFAPPGSNLEVKTADEQKAKPVVDYDP